MHVVHYNSQTTTSMAQLEQSNPDESKKSRSRKGLYIDMTPMVDLAFLLLTFFVMTSVLVKPFSLQLDQPDEKTTAPRPPIKPERVLNIVLGEHDKIYWYVADKPEVKLTSFSAEGIRKVLREKNKHINKMYVLIKPTGKSKYRNVIDILDEMAISNIERFALVKTDDMDDRLIAASGL